jgi:hypothetical protein
MNRLSAIWILLLVTLMGCATMPKANPRVEAKLEEANAALDRLSADLPLFYSNLEALLQDLKTLYDYPGWSDLEAILASTFPEPENEERVPGNLGMKQALHDWMARWGESGEDLYSRYLSLVDRCTISEARRIGLAGRLSSLQATYLEVTFMELAANRHAQAKAVFATVEALSKAEDELNSYSLNALDLYDAKPLP